MGSREHPPPGPSPGLGVGAKAGWGAVGVGAAAASGAGPVPWESPGPGRSRRRAWLGEASRIHRGLPGRWGAWGRGEGDPEGDTASLQPAEPPRDLDRDALGVAVGGQTLRGSRPPTFLSRLPPRERVRSCGSSSRSHRDFQAESRHPWRVWVRRVRSPWGPPLPPPPPAAPSRAPDQISLPSRLPPLSQPLSSLMPGALPWCHGKRDHGRETPETTSSGEREGVWKG